MPAQITERPFTDAEKAQLQRMLMAIPDGLARLKVAFRQALVAWAFSSLLAVILWLVVAAIAKALTGVAFGWTSPYVVHGLVLCLLSSGIFSFVSALRWLKLHKSIAPVIRRDLANGIAHVEDQEFSEVKRFQEQEHGGLIYFLRSSAGTPYVMFDSESQTLGAQEKNPLNSSFAPRAALRTVRAPASQLVLASEFTGDPLPLPEPIPLTAPLADWPEDDGHSSVPWDQLEARYTGGA